MYVYFPFVLLKSRLIQFHYILYKKIRSIKKNAILMILYNIISLKILEWGDTIDTNSAECSEDSTSSKKNVCFIETWFLESLIKLNLNVIFNLRLNFYGENLKIRLKNVLLGSSEKKCCCEEMASIFWISTFSRIRIILIHSSERVENEGIGECSVGMLSYV